MLRYKYRPDEEKQIVVDLLIHFSRLPYSITKQRNVHRSMTFVDRLPKESKGEIMIQFLFSPQHTDQSPQPTANLTKHNIRE